MLFVASMADRPQSLAIVPPGHTKDAAYIAELWITQIEETGPEHVSVIITDGAAVNRAAARIVTDK